MGVPNVKMAAGKYVIIPCTGKPVSSKFRLSVHSDTEIDMYSITKSWEHAVRKKGAWKEGTSGGSPNEGSFMKNPQYLLKIPNGKRTEMVIDLSVPDDLDAVGFIIVKVDGSFLIRFFQKNLTCTL